MVYNVPTYSITLCNYCSIVVSAIYRLTAVAILVARLDDIPREGGAPTHSLVLSVGQEINTEQVWLLSPFLSVRGSRCVVTASELVYMYTCM